MTWDDLGMYVILMVIAAILAIVVGKTLIDHWAEKEIEIDEAFRKTEIEFERRERRGGW